MDASGTTCRNCNAELHGKYCSRCGEKVYSEKDKSLAHVLDEVFHFITHLDSKFLKTFWLIFRNPGFISKEFAEGKKRKYFKPISLFLVGVVAYLLFPMPQGLNLAFEHHIKNNNSIGLSYPQRWTERKMEKENIPVEELAKKFDALSPKFSKVLLLLLLPMTAVALSVLFYRRKNYFYDDFLLATEINTFYLFFFFLLMPSLMKLVKYVFSIEGDFASSGVISLIMALVFCIFPVVSFRRFYSVSWIQAILKTLLFIVFCVLILFIYRQIVFVTVMMFL